MAKRILLASLFLVMTTTLGGCRLPFTSKQITLPFFEKDPATAIDLMMDAQTNMKTAHFETDLTMDVTVDAAKLTKKMAEEMNSTSSLAMLSALPPQIKLGLNLDMRGDMDASDVKNIKESLTALAKLDTGGMDLKFNFDMVMLGEIMYLKISQLPIPFDLGMEIAGKWWKMDVVKMQEKAKEMAEATGEEADLPIMDFKTEMEKSLAMEAKFMEVIKKYKLIRADERLTDEKIDEHKCYHYKVSLDKTNLDQALSEAVDIYQEDALSLVKGDEVEQLKESLKIAKLAVDQADDVITEASGEIWVDKKTFNLRQAKYGVALDVSKLDLKKIMPDDPNADINIPAGAITISFNIESKYSNINEPVTINAPENSEDLIEVLFGQLESARENARDVKRLSDIKQIQTGLELYYADNSKYPDNLEALASGEVVYFREIPTNPTAVNDSCSTKEYNYMVKDAGQSYELKYCLASDSGLIKAGDHTATPQGIAEDNSDLGDGKIDSDLDGLTNDEEKILGTDPNNSDTDGDGYLDGVEVEAGYDPLK